MAGGMGCLKKACLPREEREEQLLLPLLSNHRGESHALTDFFFPCLMRTQSNSIATVDAKQAERRK